MSEKAIVRSTRTTSSVNSNGSIGTLASPAVLKTVMCLIKAIAGSTPAATASFLGNYFRNNIKKFGGGLFFEICLFGSIYDA